jgi:hypothetical protein
MSMQMDAYLKKEQIGTLFVWVGALKGGWGGVPSGVSTPKSIHVIPKKKLLQGLTIILFCTNRCFKRYQWAKNRSVKLA